MAVVLCAWAGRAAADLYRWVDPETGSVKFSSYPPPWFNDPASQKRAPKVEVIAPGKSTPAFGTEPADEREAPPQSLDNGRGALMKSLAQQIATLNSSPPEAMGKAYGDLVEALQQLEKLDRQLSSGDTKDEATRLEAKWRLAAPLEARRTALLQQVSVLSPPPPGSPPDKIEGAWAGTQRLLGALGWVDAAIVSIDPRKANARHFEMNAIIDKLVAQWEPYVDPGVLRKNRGR